MQEPGVRTQRRHAYDVVVVLVVVAASLAGPVVGAIAVLLWAQFSRTPMREFGFKAPPNWLLVLAFSVTLGFALRIALKALVMPLLGAPAVNAPYRHLAGNTSALPGVVAGVLLAGAAEELLYRGYVFERLRTLLGAGQWVLHASIVVSAGVFAVAHYGDQGYLGVIQSAITGIVFAAVFAWQGHIWTPIIAHVTFNLTSVALIYSGLEEAVARAVFR
jgi:membrane protease YdiL (CAAX protease family)